MPKFLTILGGIVAAVLLLLFGLDLAIGIPFGKFSKTMDILLILASAMLGYMAWSTYREQK